MQIFNPLAPGLNDSEELRESILKKLLIDFEDPTQQNVKNNIIFKESFGVKDFKMTIIRSR